MVRRSCGLLAKYTRWVVNSLKYLQLFSLYTYIVRSEDNSEQYSLFQGVQLSVCVAIGSTTLSASCCRTTTVLVGKTSSNGAIYQLNFDMIFSQLCRSLQCFPSMLLIAESQYFRVVFFHQQTVSALYSLSCFTYSQTGINI